MNNRRLQAAIVGVGLAATAHIRGYKTHPYAEVVAVCDLDQARATTFAQQHNIPQIFGNFDELLSQPDIDIIDIATPTFLHAEMTRKAALAGKHIHCEKPFCRSVAEGEMAWQVAQEKGVKLMVGETYVFLSSHIKARELIDAGEIGRPLQIRQRHGAWYNRSETTRQMVPADRRWRLDGEKSGGGAYPWIFDHAVHFFATAEYLMADATIEQVYAVPVERQGHISKQSGADHDPYETAEVDIPIITWTYTDRDRQGVWTRAERLNGKYDFRHGFSTAIMGETGMIEVLGEGGHNLLWNGEQVHLLLHREGKESLSFRFDEGGDTVWDSDISYYGQGHINQAHHLIDAILSDTPVCYNGRDGTHAVQCTLAVIRSAQEGMPIRVDEVEKGFTAY
ncbi:MAG: Gfo/Idh/MocA family oxidoreductase [Chloroflexota bacterium]